MKVYVINVPTATDRKEAFLANYPSDVLPEPVIWEAKTGEEVTVPDWWQGSANRWALVQNFIDIFNEELKSEEDVLVFEDDCIFHDDFSYLYTEFMKEVPNDYGIIFLGFQPFAKSKQISDMVLQLGPSLCSHACIYSPSAIQVLHQLYTEPNWGCRHYNDQRKAQAIALKFVKAYGPLDNLCGQASGYSYLSDADRGERWWPQYRYVNKDNKICTNLSVRATPVMKAGLRECLANLTGSNLVGAEIGVFKGECTNVILENSNVSKLYCIDNFSCTNGQTIKKWFQLYTHKVASRVVLLEGNSTDEQIIAQIEEPLDFVYIDGDHSYDGCKADLETYSVLLKPSGILMGHDYLGREGVKQAVDEYALANGYSVRTYEDDSWKLVK